ncbi:OmpP1/FadL family transporter [Alcanivorax profundi]|uniref:OmpP1/FadL family transporter n=1 Tax=Alcanivorax profundi TaxID=2338368 RepID=UPI0032B2B1ED|tara:strand:+ start:180 stop:1475 length:1296 start_codon:yes stop_codon:yes gene_type:complete
MKKTGVLIVGSTIGLLSGQLMASGFAVSYQSVSAMGTAYAGAGVLSENASNQWYNPATLAGLRATEISIPLHQVWVDTAFKSDSDGMSLFGPQVGQGSGDFDDVEPFVGSAFLAVPISETMTFGLSIVSPFGTKIEYESGWGNAYLTPPPPAGLGTVTAGDFYATESDLQTVNINPSLGIQLTDNLNVGIGINYQTLDADIRNAATRLEGDDDAIGWNLGLTYSPDDNNHFGVAYRSEMSYEVEGDISFSDAGALLSALGGNPVAPGSYSGSADIDLPASLQLSYAGDLSDRTQLLLGVEWTEWSSLDALVVESPDLAFNPTEEFDWENTARYSLGLNHALASGTVLRFGVAKEDSTQGKDNRSAISPDSDRIWVTLGAGFNPTDNMTIDVGYAHIFVDDADISRSDKGAQLKGTYELDADVIGAQMSYRF